MAPTRELSIEAMEIIIKHLQEQNINRGVVKDVGYFTSAVFQIRGNDGKML